MKPLKELFVLLLLATIVSCESKLQPLNDYSNTVTPYRGRIRDVESARGWAEQSLLLLGPATKSGKQIREIDSYDVLVGPSTKATDAEVDTLMYVFNFADNSGFSLIDAQNGYEPIIGVAESGHFTPGQPTGVEGFDIYIDGLRERMTSRGGPISQIWYEYVMVGDSVDRNVGVKWGQGGIYGQYCANNLSGCAPTAIAQIMAYHQNPTSFNASVNMGSDFISGQTVSLNWDEMKTHVVSHYDSLSCNPYHKYIGALMRDIGSVANTSYNIGGSSSTYTSNVPSAIQHYGFNTSSVSPVSIISLTGCLYSFGPVYMDGIRTDGTTTHGHAWVADGYKDYAYYRDKYSLEIVGPGPVLVEHVLLRESHVLHINWGWDGDCDGFFNFNVYDVDNAVSYDGTHNTTGRNYNIDVIMVAVYPINPYLL